MKSKLFFSLFLALFLLSFASAFTFDNTVKTLSVDTSSKDYNPLWEKYAPVEIDNAFGLPDYLGGGVLASVTLEKHDESCGETCMSEWTQYISSDSPLIDSLKFYTVGEDGSKIEQPIRDYSLWYYHEVEDTQKTCDETPLKNGSIEYSNCVDNVIGSHYEWTPFAVGETFVAGTYDVKLLGEKRPDRAVDWVITTQGKELSSLALWGSFSLNGGVVVDDSGNGNNGTAFNQTNRTTGIVGNYAVNFSGSQDLIKINNQLMDNLSNVTISAWINYRNFTCAGSDNVIVATDYVQLKCRDNQTGIRWDNAGAVGDQVQLKVSNSWIHIVVVLYNNNSNYSEIWINGTLNSTKVSAKTIGTHYNRGIGGLNGANFFNGSIDEVNIFNVSLNSTEIAQLYAKQVVTRGLVARYSFESFQPYNATAEVTLTSPTNASTIYTSTLVNHNFTINITNGASLVNASICQNTSGSFVCSNTQTGYFNQSALLYSNATKVNTTGGFVVAKNITGLSGYKVNYSTSNLTAISGGGTIIHEYHFTNGTLQNFTSGDFCSLGATKNIRLNNSNISQPVNYILVYFRSDNNCGVLGQTEEKDTTVIGNILTTNTTANISLDYLNNKSILWNIKACDSDGACGMAVSNFTFYIDSIAPQQTINYPTAVVNLGEINQSLQLNWTVTDSNNLNKCWYNYNGTNSTPTSCVSGTANLANITLTSNKSVIFYANDTLGNLNATTMSWVYKVFVNNEMHNSSTFETATETYTVNVTANSSLTGVNLQFNGVNYSMTNMTDGTWAYTKDITTGLSGGFNYSYNYAYNSEIFNSVNYSQTINLITFAICNSTLSVPYINFAFKNESAAQETMTGYIASSSWYGWLGSGDEVKLFSVSNTTENTTRAFCFSAYNSTLNYNVSLQYANNLSSQRTWSSSGTLTNSTTQQTLYLLSSILGAYQQFQVRDIIGNPIPSALGTITRIISGSTITLGSSYSDSSGVVSFFLNPDVTYTGTFTASGYPTNTFTFIVINDIRYVIMGSTATVGGTNITANLTYYTLPSNSTLLNGTVYSIQLVTSGGNSINSILMKLYDQDNNLINSTSSGSVGTLTLVTNTSNYTSIRGIFTIANSDETINFTRLWIIGNYFQGDYSLDKQLRLFITYGFNDFIKNMLVLLIIIGLFFYMSKNSFTDNNEIKVLAIVVVMWLFSYVGWLNNPVVIGNTSLSQYAQQYGIAIVSTIAGAIFVLRRIV